MICDEIAEPDAMQESVEHRLAYFFRSPRRWRGEVHDTVRELQKFGTVMVIGGLIRDLTLHSNLEFRSDVDLVVNPRKLAMFEAYVEERGGKKNRFGGYSWSSSHWRFDVWSLKSTWAHQAGHVKVQEFRDLLNVTFFDCDAVLYDLQSKRLLTKRRYFDNLQHRIVEINLLPNPNPLGNAVRALRYAVTKDFRWGPRLARFVAQQLSEYDWQEVSSREEKAFGTTYIRRMDQRGIERKLQGYLMERRTEMLDIREYCGYIQYKLKFCKPEYGGNENAKGRR